jgi:putative endonuclease
MAPEPDTTDRDRNTDPRRHTGRRAEDICATRLRQRGWQVLARNWRIKAGEIDLIARTGPVLVMVEVKAGHAGSRAGPPSPALAVGPNKQRRLRRLASAWIATHGRSVHYREVRFDVVGVLFERDGTLAVYDHVENAF